MSRLLLIAAIGAAFACGAHAQPKPPADKAPAKQESRPASTGKSQNVENAHTHDTPSSNPAPNDAVGEDVVGLPPELLAAEIRGSLMGVSNWIRSRWVTRPGGGWRRW